MTADFSALGAKGGSYMAVGHAPNLGADPIHFLWQLRHNTGNSLFFSLITGNLPRRPVRRGLSRLAQIEESVARYLSQLDTGDLQEPMEALAAKTAHLKEKLTKLATEMQRLKAIEKEMLASPDQQISLTDPDSRSMATSGRGSGVVGYNVQVAVDTEHHLIVTHEVTNTGSDRSQLAKIASQAKDILGADHLDAVADRGYFNSPEILACEQADITVTLPKPMTSGAKSDGRFGKQDFVYLPTEDVYRCPTGEKLAYRYTNEEDGKTLRRYWTTACPRCPLKSRCTTGPSGESRDGNTSTCSKRCSSVSMRTRRRCACAARQLSIPSVRSRCGWVRRTF